MEKIGSAKWILSFVSVAHFFVDFACIFLVMALLPAKNWVLYALLYNFCAFGLQFPVGLAADLCRSHLKFSSWGCLLIALSFFLVAASPVLGCIAAGIGNAMFHIGGGVTVMHSFSKKMAPLGVFVSPGALGVFLAMAAVPWKDIFFYLCLDVMFVAFLLFLFLSLKEEKQTHHAGKSLKDLRLAAMVAMLLLFAAVVLRSYFGLILTFSWKTGFWLPFLFICGVALGKALGGFWGDRFGLLPAALGSLGLSAMCFLFAETSIFCGILGVCFFNMTMPLTLFSLGEILGDAKGCAFGLTTFALFLGTLPTLFPSLTFSGDLTVMILLIVASAMLIVHGVSLGFGRRKI